MLDRPLSRPLWEPLHRDLDRTGEGIGGGDVSTLILSAPEGAYAGATAIVTGGQPVAYLIGVDDDLYAILVGEFGMTATLYKFVVNGAEVGDWFESPGEFPEFLIPDDTVRVKDIAGNLSNALTGEWGPNVFYTPGVVGNLATVANDGSLGGFEDFTFEWRGVIQNIPGAVGALMGEYSPNYPGLFWLSPAGFALFFDDAIGPIGTRSFPTVGVSYGDFVAFRVSRSGTNLTMWQDIGTGWQELGTMTVSGLPLNAYSTPMKIGGYDPSNSGPFLGKTYLTRLWDNADPDGTIPILHLNFTAQTVGATSFPAATGQTVSILSVGVDPAAIVVGP